MITNEEFKKYGFEVKYSFLGGEAEIELDPCREDQEWRYFRLHRVAGYLRAVADSTGNYDLLRKLARIQDQKGSMFVFWHEPPTDDEKEALRKAWNSEGEDGDFIEHEMEEEA